MKFKLIETLKETDEITPNYIVITEANLNRVVGGHDEMGYAIVSASRQNLYKTPSGEIYSVKSGEKKHSEDDVELEPGSPEHIDANNVRTKELRTFLRNNHYSYLPVYGGFKEFGREKASIEKSFLVLPYNKETHTYTDFNKFAKDLLDECDNYQQDAILIKYPDKSPIYYDCSTKKPVGNSFSSVTLNDVTKEYFTALKKWGDISKKNSSTFTKGKPQRFTFEEAYMNDFPNSISEHRLRSSQGELVRFKNYPKDN